MSNYNQSTFRDLDEDAVIRSILEGTTTETGERFFAALVENLSKALNTHSAWVTEFIWESRQLRALAFWADGELIPDFEIDINETPCEKVFESAQLVHYPDNVIELFPKSPNLKKFRAVSYMGVPLLDPTGKILGNLAVLDTRPMPEEPRSLAIFQIFAARATAELQRLRVESEVRKSEEKYRRIVETAGEGFILMDNNFIINDVNEAFCKMIGYSREEVIGRAAFDFSFEDAGLNLRIGQKENLSGDDRKFEDNLVSKDGRNIPILVHRNTLRDDNGAVIGNMAFVTDMTEHKNSMALAGEIQKSLLPQKNPQIRGLDVAGKNVTCDEIGGDYFDYLIGLGCSNNDFDVVVGDVTGHGVDAALLMTTARAFLRMRASQCGAISQIITEMNRHLTQDILDTGRFMTLFYVSIDPENKKLQWVRAGHDPAIIYDPAENKFEELNGDGLALGIDGSYVFEENLKTGLREGQIIAIGTDGIWETFNRNGKMFGKERFRDIIRENAYLGANEIIDAVYNELNVFSSGLKKKDDSTLVIIKLEEISEKIEDWQI
jgi:PAS domain S-box-containing protein